MRGDGRTFQRSQVWWIAYYAPKDGRSVELREPAIISDRDDAPPRPARTETEARRALKRRLQEVAVHKAGVQQFQGPAKERVPLEDLLRAMERDYEVRGLRSLPALRSHLAHVRDYFNGDRAASVTTDRLREYVTHQQGEGMSPQSIHHQLKAIRRAFRLAGTASAFMPKIPIIAVTNARQGFIERADFEALVASMGEMRGRGKDKRFVPDSDLQDFTAFAFWTGMRKGELAKLTWKAVTRGKPWTLRLAPGTTKTGKGRVLVLVGPLREIIERRDKARRLDCEAIFHRDGLPIVEFRKAWATAVKRAGLRGLLFHDLRRSAIRNMVRAGVTQTVAMKISGHTTEAVFRRYDITSEADIGDAIAKTTEYVSAQPSERTVEPIEGRR